MSSNGIHSLGQKQQSVIYIPHELMLAIFKRLTRKELFQAMQVCKEWLNLAQDHFLWKKEFTVLQLSDKVFSSLSSKINLLKKCVDSTQPLLSKTSELLSKRDKLDLHTKVTNGCLAASQLYELDIKPFNLLKEYADFLNANHQDQKGLFWSIDALIRQNNYGKAFDILCKLEASPEKDSLINQLIIQFCKKNKIQEAIDLLEKLSQARYAVSQEVVNAVFTKVGETEGLAEIQKGKNSNVAIEEAIDKAFIQIFSQMDSYLKANKKHEVSLILEKYSKDFEKVSKHHVNKLIEIYVQLNMTDKAWELAKKHADDDSILHVLKNAFEAFNLQAEAHKVEEILSIQSFQNQ